MKQRSFWGWLSAVSMSTVGFAALALAAGLWALTRFKRKDQGPQREQEAPSVLLPVSPEVSDDEEDELWSHIASILENQKKAGAQNQQNGQLREQEAPKVQLPASADVSDDEEDDLWDHIASMLESRKKAGSQSQVNTLEDDEEVWRIIAQIVAARKHSHRKFQSPDKTSTLSVKELRHWFESQSAKREQVGHRNEPPERTADDNRGSNGIAQSSINGLSEQSENKSAPSQVEKAEALSKETEREKEGDGIPAQKSSKRQGVSATDISSERAPVSRKIVRRQKSPPNEVQDAINADTSPAVVNGTEQASPEKEANGVNKIVRRQKSHPKNFEELLGSDLPRSSENGAGQESPETPKKVNKIVRRQKSSSRDISPPDSPLDESISHASSEASKIGGAENGKQNGGPDLGIGSQAGGSEYQGPPGGEDRVVVYMTSVRAVRKTFEECTTVRHIFHGFSVAVDDRDISIHLPYRQELKDLMGGRLAAVPQVFIRGKHIGGLHEVRYLADEKKMHELLEGMPRIKVTEECEGCGGGKFLPCIDCRGSRKIMAGDKVETCPACNEYGLIRCPMCA